MAKIYESQGEQTALRGPARGAGFDPVQAYDPTQQVLRSAEWELGLQRKDFKALTEFSDTLSKFAIDKTKEFNEQQKNLGVADYLNGDVKINDAKMQQYQEQAQLLDQATNNEIAVASELAATNPGAGETYRQQNPVINGWRAYGQAIGKSQLAATQAEGFFGSFLRNRQDSVQIRQADGSIKTFLPGEAESQPELMAAWSVGLQKFMADSGISDINPAILVEHLTPTMLRVRAKLMGERVEEITRKRKDMEREKINIEIGQNIEGLGDPELGQRILTTLLNNASKTFDTWGEANQFVNEAVLSKLTAFGRANPKKAATILTKYGELMLDPNKPELGTIYNRYAAEIEQAQAVIKGSAREAAADKDAEIKKEIETIENTWKSASETGNLAESQRAYDAAEQELGKLSATHPEATAALTRIRQQGRNANSLTAEAVEKAVASGTIKSQSEIDILAANGYISGELANNLKSQLPEDKFQDDLKQIRPDIEATIRARLRADMKAEGMDPDAFKDKTQSLVSALTDEVLAIGLSELLEAKVNGRTVGRGQLRSQLQQQALKDLNTPRFKLQEIKTPDGKGTGRFTLPDPGSVLPKSVPYLQGPSGRDYSQQLINRLPRVVSAKRDVLLDAEKVQANIDALNNGGQPSPDLVTIAKASGLSVRQVLTQQAQKNGLTYTPASTDVAAKKFDENFKLDPTAANILANPRSTPTERIRANGRLAAAKNRQTASGGGGGGKALEDLRSALISKEGGRMGYSGANRGRAGDTPGGVAGLENMTIAQVKALYKQGYNALGAYQFIAGTLPIVQAAAGIPDNAKFNQQTQDKLFEAVLFQGANNRTRLSNYLNGRSNDLRGAVEDFSNEFAAAFNPSGGSRYAGTAGNSPSLSVTDYLRRLRQERQSQVKKSVDMTSRNVQSITFENSSGQPGMDLWFADKQFGAVLPGVVKDINQQSGYGNYAVVESIDPLSGEKVDVLYAHLDQIYFKPGDRITAGTAIGKQGSTGNVKSVDGTIASVDFLAPAPKGSRSMTPYRNFDRLRRELARRIQSGTFR